MNASACAAIAVVILDVYVGARYCVKLIRKQIAPRIATWLIFEIGVIMSLAAYFTSHDHSLTKAALNATDSIMVTVILSTILIQQRGRAILFTRNEQLCLFFSCVATAAWMVTSTGWIGLVGFQLVMSIAYIPTIESVWRWKPDLSPEPIEKWSVNAVIAFIGVVVDITDRRDYLALIYPLRAFILCAIVVVLIHRWNQKNKAKFSRAR